MQSRACVAIPCSEITLTFSKDVYSECAVVCSRRSESNFDTDGQVWEPFRDWHFCWLCSLCLSPIFIKGLKGVSTFSSVDVNWTGTVGEIKIQNSL